LVREGIIEDGASIDITSAEGQTIIICEGRNEASLYFTYGAGAGVSTHFLLNLLDPG